MSAPACRFRVTLQSLVAALGQYQPMIAAKSELRFVVVMMPPPPSLPDSMVIDLALCAARLRDF
jgi:hypothetical protein